MDDLRRYAARLCGQLDAILQHGDRHLGATVVRPANGVPLAACRFVSLPSSTRANIEVFTLTDADEVLARLDKDLRVEVADHLFVRRDLRVYDGQAFWIIKPAERRYWSGAAALNDADAVIREHMDGLAHARPA